MREIKFRAWLGGVLHPVWQRIDAEVYKTHPDIQIMQYTGLKDKNGKEIYEGDLMQALPSGTEPRVIREVVWKFGKFVLIARADWNEDENPEEIAGLGASLKVIGNIMENPELLNKEEK